MRTGVAYMGHHNPRHLETDMLEMRELGLDDVFVCTQENDFRHFTGKVNFAPKIAAEHGLRPIAIFWGALNLFGGGRSSQFLLHNPEGFRYLGRGKYFYFRFRSRRTTRRFVRVGPPKRCPKLTR